MYLEKRHFSPKIGKKMQKIVIITSTPAKKFLLVSFTVLIARSSIYKSVCHPPPKKREDPKSR
jgi:hypothetical protein